MMRFLVILALAYTAVVQATQQLTAATYQELMSSGKNGMIKFYQPWCGHCTRMKPAWDALAEQAHSSVFIADVNCSDEDDLCQQNQVQGYPTIKVYKDGQETKYEGARELEAMLAYVDSELATKCDLQVAGSCSDKAVEYAATWTAKNDPAAVAKELARLTGMAGKSMQADLKKWLQERIAVLKQLSAPAAAEEEKKEL